MKGRSKITFSRKNKRLLKGMEEDDSNADLISRASWLRTAAGHHTKLANRLISVARTMKPNTSDAAKEIDRHLVNGRTVMAYKKIAGRCSKKEILTKEQKDQIKESWKRKRESKSNKHAPHQHTGGRRIYQHIRRGPNVRD